MCCEDSETMTISLLRCGSPQWNKLLGCMKYEILVWYNKSVYFNGTAHTMKQETYVSWNIFHETYCVAWGNVAQLQTFFLRFKWKDYNKLCEIYFLSVHWAANMLHTIYLRNMFQAMCFIGVRCALLTAKMCIGCGKSQFLQSHYMRIR